MEDLLIAIMAVAAYISFLKKLIKRDGEVKSAKVLGVIVKLLCKVAMILSVAIALKRFFL